MWRCFHCDESFTDATAAETHFGKSESSRPACQLDAAEYRAMEERMRRYNDEDSDLHREIHRIESRYQQALQREEEAGYARGLKDGGAVPAPVEPPTLTDAQEGGKPGTAYPVWVPVAPNLPCGHPGSLLLRSAETGEPLYCELCDAIAGRRDAETMEAELRVKLAECEDSCRHLSAALAGAVELPTLPLMRAAFRTEVSSGLDGLYEMRFKFPSLAALHDAGREWVAAVPAPVLPSDPADLPPTHPRST